MRHLLRGLIPATLLATLPAATFAVTTTFGSTSSVSQEMRMGFTARAEDIGARITGNGLVSGSLRAEAFAVGLNPAGERELLIFPTDNLTLPPTVTARLPLGGGASSASVTVMARPDGNLALASANEIGLVDRRDTAGTTVTLHAVPSLAGFAGACFDSGGNRVFRLGGQTLEAWQTSDDRTVAPTLIKSAAGGGTAIAKHEPSGLLVALAGNAIRVRRWGTEDAGPTDVGTLSVPDAIPTGPIVTSSYDDSLVIPGTNSLLLVRLTPAGVPWLSRTIEVPGQPVFAPAAVGVLAGCYDRLMMSGSDLLPVQQIAGWPCPQSPLYSASAYNENTLLLFPQVAAGVPQPATFFTMTPLSDPAYLQGILFSPAAGTEIVKVAARPASAIATIHLYSRTGTEPFVRRWQSMAIVSPAQGVEINPALPVAAGETWAAVAELMGSGIMNQVGSDAAGGASGFRLPYGNQFAPAGFADTELLPHSGIAAIKVTAETPLRLDSLTVRGEEGADGFTRGTLLTILAPGDFERIEFSTFPTFSISSTKVWDASQKYTYLMDNLLRGEVTIYVRLRTANRTSTTYTTKVVVDRTGPTLAGTPRIERTGSLTSGNLLVSWDPAVDNVGGSGIGDYYWTFRNAVTGSVVEGTATSPSFTVIAAPGSYRASVTARDKVGNGSGTISTTTPFTVYHDELPSLIYAETNYQYVNSPHAWLQHGGNSRNPTISQISESAAFEPPVAETNFGWWKRYSLQDTSEGPHTIYHRLKTELGVSNVLTSTIFLDTQAPIAAPPVAESRFAPDGIVNVVWRLPSDPEPASGIPPGSGYSVFALRRVDDSIGVGSYSFPFVRDESGLTTTTLTLLPGTPGGQFRARIANVTDKAGNTMAEVFSEPFEINARPYPPAVMLDPAVPTSDRITRVTALASDPDGDAITRIDYRFVRKDHPETEVAGDTLLPGVAKRGQVWYAGAKAIDARGATGWESLQHFTMGNGKPSQPVVRIKPRVPVAGTSIIVDVLVYSIDPDGDRVGYDFRWSKSADGGQTWIQKSELDGSAFVDGQYIEDGELWQVEYIPFEVSASTKGARVEGKAARDVVRVGTDNTPPEIAAGAPQALVGPDGTTRVRAYWSASDAQGGSIRMSIYLTDLGLMGAQLIAADVDASLGYYEFDVRLLTDGPYYVQLIATDDRGAVTQTITLPLSAVQANSASGWMLE